MATTFLTIVGPFTIRELTGEQRVLRLVGRALPYRPFTLASSQRLELTWYPGNPVATAQVLGAKTEPTTVKGYWKDRFIADTLEVTGAGGDTQQVGAASLNDVAIPLVSDLTEIVDDFCRKGQLVEVTWQHTARHGYLSRFLQTWNTLRDCEWEMEFTWTSKAEGGEAGLLQREVDLSEINNSANTNLAGVTSALNDPIVSLGSMADVVNADVQQLQSAISGLEDGVIGTIDGVVSSFDAARRAVGLLGFIVQEADNMIETLYSQQYQWFIADIDPTTAIQNVGAVPLGKAIAAAAGRAQLVRSSRKLKHDSARSQARLVRNIDPDLVQTFYARADQDLRDVSLRFFGTADEWQKIARYNGLTSSKLSAGQVVLVPTTFREDGTTS